MLPRWGQNGVGAMFVNVIKNRIVRWIIYAVLGTLCLYNGTSCVAALHKAGKQPYLLSGTERFDFVGYHMMAAMYGVICIAITVMLILLVRWKRRNNK